MTSSLYGAIWIRFCLISLLCILIFSGPKDTVSLLRDNNWHNFQISLDGDKKKTCNCFFFFFFRVFKRVLPLPNGNWNAIVDDWCCHPDPFANKKLLPRAEDCLLGDTFLLLARDGSCEQTLTVEVSPVGAEDSQDPKVSGAQGKTATLLCHSSQSLQRDRSPQNQ